ncbi:hypothetical protein [uncultured Croceitalea sp.]|uniref:OB-fold protein n=1 Tax=uncultured Croceitalea sp. TaxID=1798908 RepID=UPI0033065E5C
MRLKKYFTIVLIAVAIVGFFSYKYMYKPHRNVAEEQVTAALSATELQGTFANSNGTLNIFSDKIIEVNGSITDMEQSTTVIIDDKVQIDFDNKEKMDRTLSKGNNITIKGRCVGYDDLLEIVKVDQAILIN